MQYSSCLPLFILPLLLYVFPSQGAELANIDKCGQNTEARKLAELIIQDTAQKRAAIRCNPLLSTVAMEKAMDMADYGIVRHNLGGSPNSRLRQAGFKLPVYYGGAMSNQVEAIAGGYPTAEVVWEAFKKSPSHRRHLLGEGEFYREQDQLGVGFYRDNGSPHVEYWVVYLTKQRDQKPPQRFEEIPNKGIDILIPKDEESGIKP